MKVVQVVLLLLIHFHISAQKPKVFVVDENFRAADLVGYVSRFDSEKDETIEYVSQKATFKLSAEVPSFKADSQYHWLKIDLKASARKPIVIEFQQIFVDDISSFLFENDSLKEQFSSSWEKPFVNKPFPSRYHAFEFEVSNNKSYTLFLRCHNSKIKYSSRAFLKIFEKKNYEKESDTYLLQYALSVGCLWFVTILSLGFFGYSRKKIYVYYGLYLISMSLYFLVVNGVINQFFNPQTDFIAKPEFGSLLVVFNLAFHILYVFEFFKIKNRALLWGYCIFLLLSILQAGFILFNPQTHIPYSIIYLYFSLLIILTILYNFKANRKAVLLYLLASGPLFLTFLLVILGAIGLTKINTFFYYNAHIPLTLEGLGLGLALLYQFNDDQKKVEKELEKNRMETTHKILLAQEEERQILARDLHDDLGGSLSVLNRELDEFNEINGGKISDTVRLTQKIVEDLRLISHHLMPSSFPEKGLTAVIKETVGMANRQNKLKFDFITNGQEKRLHPDSEINIYRIVKELINNTLKHSGGTLSTIQLLFYDDFLYFSIEDNGRGFDINHSKNWGIGFKNINLRAGFLKAKLNTESGPTGSLISLEIPYNAS